MIKSLRLSAVLVMLLMMIFVLNSCTKTGATGATGATGTANVMYSNWANLKMTYDSDDSAYEQTITADSVTQAVLDSGLVLSYIKYTNSAGVTQVESTSTYMEEVLGLKTIQLYSYTYDFTGVPYRYIVIKGGTSIGSRLSASTTLIQGHTAAEWKAMTYDQVVAALKE